MRSSPVANVEIDTRGKEYQQAASCLLDIGFDVALAWTDLEKYGEELRSTEVWFCGVVLHGALEETGGERSGLKTIGVDLEVDFVDSIRIWYRDG